MILGRSPAAQGLRDLPGVGENSNGGKLKYIYIFSGGGNFSGKKSVLVEIDGIYIYIFSGNFSGKKCVLVEIDGIYIYISIYLVGGFNLPL